MSTKKKRSRKDTHTRQKAKHGASRDAGKVSVALLCAQGGLAVIPLHGTKDGHYTCRDPNCDQPGSHPRTTNGLRDATRDPQLVRSMWKKWPKAKIGMALGRPTKLLALVTDGQAARRQLEAIAADGELPRTVTILDDERRFYLYRYDRRPLPNCDLGGEVRILGDGNFIIAPSNLDSDAKRRFAIGRSPKAIEIARAPDWLLRIRAEPVKETGSAPVSTPPVQPVRQLRSRTAEDIANEQTVEQLALRIWAATVGEKVLKDMSALVDELLQSHLLDDDDEEADQGWLDDQHKREKKLLKEAIPDGLEKYPDIAAVNDLPVNSDPDIARDAEQLKTTLMSCPIGATRFEEKFSPAQLERMVKRDLEARFNRDPKYSAHVREDVPGSEIKKYGSRGRTSSKGTFIKGFDYEGGGGLDALLTGGWLRVAKDRLDPLAWSHQFGFQRKTECQSWRHHFLITERNGHQSPFELPREKLAGSGAAALKLLMKAGVHIVAREAVPKALAQFLRFKPKNEIVRMPRVGWAQVGSHWIFVRPDVVITPPGMPQAGHMGYVLDAAATRHGLHVAGTAAEWTAEIAAPLEGNSNVGLSFATFFAAPLLSFASEPGGGVHLHGHSTIGKTMISAAGQSIYGWPHETADDAFGVSWGGSEAGFDALALARTDLGLPLDEITLANPRTAEQIVYKVASGTKGPRATSAGYLRETAHASVLVFSTGEKSLSQFIGPNLQEGARKRLVDVPAEVQPGSAFETIPRERIHTEGRRLFDAMKRQHGAVGRDWQRYLVELGPEKIKANLDRHREAYLTLPEVIAVTEKAHPQVKAVVNRSALSAAALRMAIDAGLLLWTVENADAGIVACIQRWVAQRGNLDTAGEIVRAAHQIELDLVAGLNYRFIRIHKTTKGWTPATEADAVKQETPELFDGYTKPDRVLVRPDAWRRYANGFDPSEVARHFQERGILIAGDNGTSRAEQVIGTIGRFYVLSRAVLTPLTP